MAGPEVADRPDSVVLPQGPPRHKAPRRSVKPCVVRVYNVVSPFSKSRPRPGSPLVISRHSSVTTSPRYRAECTCEPKSARMLMPSA